MSTKQNPFENLLLKCECHSYHYVEFFGDPDFGLTITHVERPRGWKEKARVILQALKNETIFDGDLIVKGQDYDKLLKYLREQKKNMKKK